VVARILGESQRRLKTDSSITIDKCRNRKIQEAQVNFFSPIVLLFISNIAMTFAWYAHLKHLNNKPLWIAIFVSWAIALVEYIFQVPANRIGFLSGAYSLAQMKIVQEVITLLVFIPFAIFYMKQPMTLNYLWAGFCLAGAVFFIFR
jgi:uncharacterized protein (DUF486 family)